MNDVLFAGTVGGFLDSIGAPRVASAWSIRESARWHDLSMRRVRRETVIEMAQLRRLVRSTYKTLVRTGNPFDRATHRETKFALLVVRSLWHEIRGW